MSPNVGPFQTPPTNFVCADTGDRMLILGDRVFESTLGEGGRVSLGETTLEEETGEFGGDKP